jgi:hypothetical protein
VSSENAYWKPLHPPPSTAMRSKGASPPLATRVSPPVFSSAASCRSRRTHASVRTRSSARTVAAPVPSAPGPSPGPSPGVEEEVAAVSEATPRNVLRETRLASSRALGASRSGESLAAVQETSARVSSPCGFLVAVPGREEGTRRSQTGRRWANSGGDAGWRGRRSRERCAGSSVGGRTSRIVARSKGALAPPRRARRDAPSLKGRAHRSEDVALFSRKEMSSTDRLARRLSRTRPILTVLMFSHFCDRSPWRRQSTGAPRRRAPTSRGRSAIC